MKKLNDLRLLFSAFLASAATLYSYFLKEHYAWEINWVKGIIGVLLITSISYFIPKVLSHLFLKFQWFRKLIYGKNLLEGYWFLKSYDATTKQNKLDRDGIADISFNSEKSCFEIIVTRVNDSGNEEFTTNSKNFILLDEDNSVVNLFSYILGEQKIEGVSTGQFKHSGSATTIDKYDGRILTLNNNEIVIQKGERIPNAIVNIQKKLHGDDWKGKFIEEKKKK